MLFNSLEFLLFFPIVVIFYFVLPHKIRWIYLLLASYFFYMCWNAVYALLMFTSTLITYLSGILIANSRKRQKEGMNAVPPKYWVALSFCSNIAILVFFKYFYFLIENINYILAALNMQIIVPGFDIILPVGISFYTFQALSYTVDVYREDIPAEKNLFKYALFVSFFPQLVAGPIERSSNLLKQVHERHYFDYDRMVSGLLLMGWGYFQKMVVADRASILVDQVFNHYYDYYGFEIAIAAVLFAVQIYGDFAGYSNIAIGAAQIMGFRLMDNFHQPYLATSIPDFWSRWHISLSTWFRDYLYIPLGGNRKGKTRTYLNKMITFLVSGFWHGAAWTYVAWGGIHGAYQVIGSITLPARNKLKKKLQINTTAYSYKVFQIIFTFCLVDFAWIFFRAENLAEAIGIIRNLFYKFNPEIFFEGKIFEMGLESREVWVLLLAIVVLYVGDFLQTKMYVRDKIKKQNLVFRWVIYFVLIYTIAIFGIYGTGYDATQFIYFQF